MTEQHSKLVVSWACMTLTALGVHFEANEYGWDVMTVDGWISVETPGGLAQVATRCQAEQMAGRAQGTSL